MPHPQKILIQKKHEIVKQMIWDGKTDVEIRLAVNRPELDMRFFRSIYPQGNKI